MLVYCFYSPPLPHTREVDEIGTPAQNLSVQKHWNQIISYNNTNLYNCIILISITLFHYKMSAATLVSNNQ